MWKWGINRVILHIQKRLPAKNGMSIVDYVSRLHSITTNLRLTATLFFTQRDGIMNLDVSTADHATSRQPFWMTSSGGKQGDQGTCRWNLQYLGPSDAIWRWRSWSTLVQVMACCLTTPSHYLNQCWLIISKVPWHSSEDITIRQFEDTNQ